MKLYRSAAEGGAPVYFGPGALDQLPAEVDRLAPDRAFILMDRTVEALLGERIRENLPHSLPLQTVLFNEGEENKNLATLQLLAADMLRGGVSDASLVLCVGGGVALDLGGLAASLLRHGVPFAQVATTLTAQWQVVGRNLRAINVAGSRNALRLYRPAQFAIADPLLLESEPPRSIRAGLVDLARLGLVLGGQAFESADRILSADGFDALPLLAQTARDAFELKQDLLRRDPRELQADALEAYGATAGRPLEILAEGRLLPGEARWFGMRIAGALALLLDLMSPQDWRRHESLLDKVRPLAPFPRSVAPDRLVSLLHGNNKTLADGLPFMLLDRPGIVARASQDRPWDARVGVSDEAVAEAVQRVRADALL